MMRAWDLWTHIYIIYIIYIEVLYIYYICNIYIIYICIIYILYIYIIANQRVLLVLTSPEITFVARSATAQLAPQPCFARLQWNRSHSSPWTKMTGASGVNSTRLPSSPTNRRGQTTRHFTPGVGSHSPPLPSVATPSVRIIRSAYQNGNSRTSTPRLRPQELLALRLWPWESSCLVRGFSSSFLGLLCTNLSHRNRSLTYWNQPVSELVR